MLHISFISLGSPRIQSADQGVVMGPQRLSGALCAGYTSSAIWQPILMGELGEVGQAFSFRAASGPCPQNVNHRVARHAHTEHVYG